MVNINLADLSLDELVELNKAIIKEREAHKEAERENFTIQFRKLMNEAREKKYDIMLPVEVDGVNADINLTDYDVLSFDISVF